MLKAAAPTDQRSGVRPIAFVLQNGLKFNAPVTLKIRPEDLSRSETSRSTVTQTLGRGVSGWADTFGAGLPSCTIAGHTGWRASGATGEDGVAAFNTLNDLLMPRYHAAKQLAIDTGTDPALVKLLFVDMLDDFCWNVVPMTFVLRRSKSRPLLMQYNIQLQAVSINVDNPLRLLPQLGSMISGLASFGTVIDKLFSLAGSIQDWVARALAFKDRLLAPIAAVVQKFVAISAAVFRAVNIAVSAVKNGISGVANSLIGIAGGIAQVGINIFRTISSIAGLPGYLKSQISGVASAYNEAFCILKNSLRPRKTYDSYDSLYGASNCSSTTGGRGPSIFSGSSVFSMMQAEKGPVGMNSAAIGSISELNRGDPVLKPMEFPEMARHVENINNGVTVYAVDPVTGVTP